MKIIRYGISKNKEIKDVLDSARQVVYGQDEMLLAIISAVVCEGHLLIEGMLVWVKHFLCLQFLNDGLEVQNSVYSDLLPSDLIGTQIFSRKRKNLRLSLDLFLLNYFLLMK